MKGSPEVIAPWKNATRPQSLLSTNGMPVYGSEYGPCSDLHSAVTIDASPETKRFPNINLQA